jgi:hypothetical protein
VFWPDLNIHIVLLRKFAIYCDYIWYILRTADFYVLGLRYPCFSCGPLYIPKQLSQKAKAVVMRAVIITFTKCKVFPPPTLPLQWLRQWEVWNIIQVTMCHNGQIVSFDDGLSLLHVLELILRIVETWTWIFLHELKGRMWRCMEGTYVELCIVLLVWGVHLACLLIKMVKEDVLSSPIKQWGEEIFFFNYYYWLPRRTKLLLDLSVFAPPPQ